MTKAKTAAERKADERERHRAAGRVAVTVHVRPDQREAVRRLEERLQRAHANSTDSVSVNPNNQSPNAHPGLIPAFARKS